MSRKITPTSVLLNQITLASSASSVNISSIPQNFSDIMLVWSGSLTSQGTYNFRINNITSGSYVSIWSAGNSNNNQSITSTGAANGASDRIPCVIYTATPSNGPVTGTWYCMDYNVTDKHKVVMFKGSGTHEIMLTGGRISTTDPITSLQVYTPEAFAAGSTFYLYGVVA